MGSYIRAMKGRERLNRRYTETRDVGRGENPDLSDLGFGSRVSRKNRERLLNRDGSFNVERTGLSFLESINAYHILLTMRWVRFYGVLLGGYIVINLIFAILFMLCGEEGLSGFAGLDVGERFLHAFFFSVQTFTTVGYGATHPTNLSADIVATLSAFVGLLSFALATGLLFARFSRPTADIIYSNHGVIAPYRGETGFMFRIANRRRSQLLNVEVVLIFTRMIGEGEERRRQYDTVRLERSHVSFFPLHWTIVHPIDKDSPLHGMGEEEFHASLSEFLILLEATDDTFAQTVHSRSSYRHDEILWETKFADPFTQMEDGSVVVDLERMHMVEGV